jgi:hypothetical protein
LEDLGQGYGSRSTRSNSRGRRSGNQGAAFGTPHEAGPEDKRDAGEVNPHVPRVAVVGTILQQLVLEVENLGLSHDGGFGCEGENEEDGEKKAALVET